MDLPPGTWVRILKGQYIGSRGFVVDADGEGRIVRVERFSSSEPPVIRLLVSDLRRASKQFPRDLLFGDGTR